MEEPLRRHQCGTSSDQRQAESKGPSPDGLFRAILLAAHSALALGARTGVGGGDGKRTGADLVEHGVAVVEENRKDVEQDACERESGSAQRPGVSVLRWLAAGRRAEMKHGRPRSSATG